MSSTVAGYFRSNPTAQYFQTELDRLEAEQQQLICQDGLHKWVTMSSEDRARSNEISQRMEDYELARDYCWESGDQSNYLIVLMKMKIKCNLFCDGN